MVANIRSHPAYKLDANGVAVGPVVPWDFNHASEQDPTTGELPALGAPSQGWTYDLQVRTDATGQAELWALTRFLEPARTYVKAGQYRWASVAVALNAVDPTTGANVGAMVTSIALTNTPFVEGMESLAASRRTNTEKYRPMKHSQANITARREFYSSAQSTEEAISDMRELFRLPETAGASEVAQQIAIVKGWFAKGAAPLGTDVQYIVGSLRTILNLPTLTPDQEVLTQAATSVQLLVQQKPGAVAPGSELVPTTELPTVRDAAAHLAKVAKWWPSMGSDDRLRAARALRDLTKNRTALLSANGKRPVALLALYPGANKTDRARAFLSMTQGASFERLGHHDQCLRAFELAKTHHILDLT